MSLLKALSSLIQDNKRKTGQCPYCHCELIKFPTRKTKCRKCGNIYYVRTDPATREKVILTASGVQENDAAWVGDHAASLLEDQIRSMLDPETFFRKKEKVRADLQSRFNKPPLKEDLIWSLANTLTLEAMRDQNFSLLSQIYWFQGIFLHAQRKNHIPVMEQFFEVKLRQMASRGTRRVEIIVAPNASCASCKKLNEKVMSITEALHLKLLPCKECTFDVSEEKGEKGWCRCVYGPALKD